MQLKVCIRRGERLTHSDSGKTYATAKRDIYSGDPMLCSDFDFEGAPARPGTVVPATVMRDMHTFNVNGRWRDFRTY